MLAGSRVERVEIKLDEFEKKLNSLKEKYNILENDLIIFRSEVLSNKEAIQSIKDDVVTEHKKTRNSVIIAILILVVQSLFMIMIEQLGK